MQPGQEPRLDLCPSGEGSQVTQPLQGPAGLQGQGPGQVGRLVLSRSLHADSLGMLQAGRQAAGRQRAPQDGQAALGDGGGWETDRWELRLGAQLPRRGAAETGRRGARDRRAGP